MAKPPSNVVQLFESVLFADERDGPSVQEVLRLVTAYQSIRDVETRGRLLELAEQIAREQNGPGAGGYTL